MTNNVGISTNRATPVQKSENMSAVMRERKRVPRTNEANSARGRKENRNCTRTKVCSLVRE